VLSADDTQLPSNPCTPLGPSNPSLCLHVQFKKILCLCHGIRFFCVFRGNRTFLETLKNGLLRFWNRQQPGLGIDFGENHAFGNLKNLDGLVFQDLAHETEPDGACGKGTLFTFSQGFFLVKTDPDPRDISRCIPNKPSVEEVV